jgi:hypothetical protein
VKLRGFRIELGEIEAVLTTQPSVRNAAVVLHEDQPGNAILIGYVVAQPGRAISSDELCHALRRTLPDYMVPAQFIVLENLPLTSYGKVDRRALPAPSTGLASTTDPSQVAPRSPLEQVLATIVAESLGLHSIAVNDSMFRLGINSLQAARIAYEINEALGTTVTVGMILAHGTVAALIEALTSEPARRASLERNAELLLKVASLTPAEIDRLAKELE